MRMQFMVSMNVPDNSDSAEVIDDIDTALGARLDEMNPGYEVIEVTVIRE